MLTRKRFLKYFAATVAAGTLACPGSAFADEPTITRVEEDWRVEVSVPEPDDHAPQIITTISPRGDLEREFAIFELNHSTQPEYLPGGMQLQGWYRDVPLELRNTPKTELLRHDGEVVTYTAAMRLDDDRLTFEIINGTSETWGLFGGQGYLKFQRVTTLSNLSGYKPEVSVANSRIGFASHRVLKLVLTEVRYYSDDALEVTDETDRVVHVYQPAK